jgi:hypothetical protein
MGIDFYGIAVEENRGSCRRGSLLGLHVLLVMFLYSAELLFSLRMVRSFGYRPANRTSQQSDPW